MSANVLISTKEVVARKPHTCNQCEKEISVGEKYRRSVCTQDDGKICNIAEHLDCYELWVELVYDNSCGDDDLPFLVDLGSLCEEEEDAIREGYPEVAERLFGKKDPDVD